MVVRRLLLLMMVVVVVLVLVFVLRPHDSSLSPVLAFRPRLATPAGCSVLPARRRHGVVVDTSVSEVVKSGFDSWNHGIPRSHVVKAPRSIKVEFTINRTNVQCSSGSFETGTSCSRKTTTAAHDLT